MEEERGGFGVVGPDGGVIDDLVLRGFLLEGGGEVESGGGGNGVPVVVEVEGAVVVWTREHAVRLGLRLNQCIG